MFTKKLIILVFVFAIYSNAVCMTRPKTPDLNVSAVRKAVENLRVSIHHACQAGNVVDCGRTSPVPVTPISRTPTYGPGAGGHFPGQNG